MDSSLALFGAAFGLGLLHALDADHIIAVSGLSLNGQPAGWRGALRFAGRWSAGHGLTLLVLGAAVLLLGAALPAALTEAAEAVVGVVLIGLGVGVLWKLRARGTHLHVHRHDGHAHAHWHRHAPATGRHDHGHGAVLVGALHGTAGSAPLLALLPLSMQSAWSGLAYLVLFALGVLAAMLVFGGLLGNLLAALSRYSLRAQHVLRASAGLLSIGYGVYWLHALR